MNQFFMLTYLNRLAIGACAAIVGIIGSYKTAAQQMLKADFSSSQLLCTVNFKPALQHDVNTEVIRYHWDFGDGNQSDNSSPVHKYSRPGRYNVALTIDYVNDNNDTVTISKERRVKYNEKSKISFTEQEVTVPVSVHADVISSTVNTYTDLNKNIGTSNDQTGFFTGARGVWRQDGSYRYLANRDMKGAYAQNAFSWKYSELNAIPEWVEIKKVKGFTSKGDVLEVQNDDGAFSSTLYDESGLYPLATGYNMQSDEMAFTSFENNARLSGNWILNSGTVSVSSAFSVLSGLGNFTLVSASIDEFNNVESVNVLSKLAQDASTTNYLQQSKILCAESYRDNPDWSVVILDRKPHDDIWIGEIVTQAVITPTVSGMSVEQGIAHSGNSSLKVISESLIEQAKLDLVPNKKYVISVWISTQGSRSENILSDRDMGIDVIFRDDAQNEIYEKSFEPTGAVVEGWQQITGEFTTPSGKSDLYIKLKPGKTGVVWYDDLRLFPDSGNMESYVYDATSGKLNAIHDNNNFTTFYFYNSEGALYLEKRETEDGIKTISENIQYTRVQLIK